MSIFENIPYEPPMKGFLPIVKEYPVENFDIRSLMARQRINAEKFAGYEAETLMIYAHEAKRVDDKWIVTYHVRHNTGGYNPTVMRPVKVQVYETDDYTKYGIDPSEIKIG